MAASREERIAQGDRRLTIGPDTDDVLTIQHDHGEHCPCCTVRDAPEGEGVPPRTGGETNPYGKESYAGTDAAGQITRNDRSWADGGGTNGTDQVVSVTYGYLAQADVNTDSDQDYRAFSQAEIAAVESAIRLIEDVAGVDLVRVTGTGSGFLDSADDAQIGLDAIIGSNGGRARTSFSGDTILSASVSIGESGLEDEGSYAFRTALHEIAHGLGLSHPGDYDGSGATTYAGQAEYFEDSGQYTVMSYWDEGETGADFGRGQATNLLLHDVAALQRLYGANEETRTGDDTYGFGADDEAWRLDGSQDFIIGAIWDAGGQDLIDVSRFDDDQSVDLRAEAFSSTGGMTWNLSIAAGVVIEDAALGAGDDTVTGNDAANVLVGGDGADILFGGAGGDLLIGDTDGGIA